MKTFPQCVKTFSQYVITLTMNFKFNRLTSKTTQLSIELQRIYYTNFQLDRFISTKIIHIYNVNKGSSTFSFKFTGLTKNAMELFIDL